MSNPTITQDEVKRLVAKNGSLLRPEAPTNKYGVADKQDRIYDGQLYDSKREAEFAAQLALQFRMGLIRDIRRQVRFPLHAATGAKVCDYVVDFDVIYADGRRVLVEVKGYWTPVARLKVRWFQAEYPDLKLEIVK